MRRLMALLPDAWTVLEVFSAGLLAGGVWAQWGWSWACMLVGAGGLALSQVRAFRSGGPQ